MSDKEKEIIKRILDFGRKVYELREKYKLPENYGEIIRNIRKYPRKEALEILERVSRFYGEFIRLIDEFTQSIKEYEEKTSEKVLVETKYKLTPLGKKIVEWLREEMKEDEDWPMGTTD